jgi:small GTP-binding protein
MNEVSKKIILVGHFGVGKTSLVKQFVHSIFSDKYLTTIGVSIEKKQLIVGNTKLTFLIWDLAGEETVARLNGTYFKGSSGAIYVFDLTRPDTYEALSQKLKELPEKAGKPMPVLAVGNKRDLMTDSAMEEVKAQLDCTPFAYTSAKTGLHVDDTFMELARQILQ